MAMAIPTLMSRNVVLPIGQATVDIIKSCIPNIIDPDDDNDGTPDTSDAFPLDANEYYDSDGCQDSTIEDLDDDNDGTPDTSDAFPLDPTEDTDTDGDGIGNNADTR